MVAVTTARHNHRPAGFSPRRLELVSRPAADRSGAATAVGPVGTAFGAGRCGCRHHRSSSGPASGRTPSASVATAPPLAGRLPASIYRRRRLVAAVVAAGLLLTAWAALGALGGALTASGRSVPDPRSAGPVAVVDVQPGDTIWSIARRVQPSGDVRPLVDRLAAAHGGTVLQVGERIVVPARR